MTMGWSKEIEILTETQHVQNHDQQEGYETKKCRNIRQYALGRVHFIEDVTETSGKENGGGTVEH